MTRRAMLRSLKHEEKRVAFLQDGIRAWNEFQATGQHVTQEEADAWLAKLAAGLDKEPPASHD